MIIGRNQTQAPRFWYSTLGFNMSYIAWLFGAWLMTFYQNIPGFFEATMTQMLLGGTGLALALGIGAIRWKADVNIPKIITYSLYGLGGITVLYLISSVIPQTLQPQSQVAVGALISVPVIMRILWFFAVGVREEEFFRGFLYAGSRMKFGRGFYGFLLSIGISAVAFWLFHQAVVLSVYNLPLYRTPAYSFVLLISGVIYALVFEMTGYLVSAMIIHSGLDITIEVVRNIGGF